MDSKQFDRRPDKRVASKVPATTTHQAEVQSQGIRAGQAKRTARGPSARQAEPEAGDAWREQGHSRR
jgi:hypothetical protein